jgi:O-antigen/teichoic acid export membrane protein
VTAVETGKHAEPPPTDVARRVFLNTTSQLAARFVGLFVSLLVLRLTTGYLGVGGFGRLAIILAFGDLLRVLSDLGVSTTLARELAKDPGSTDDLAGNLLVVRVVTSVLAICVAALVLPFLPYAHQTKLGLLVSLAAVFFLSVANFPNAFFQTNLRLELQAALDLTTKLLNLAAIVLVRALDLGFYGVVGSFVLVNGTICVLSFALSRRFWRMNLRFDWNRARPLVRASLGIGIVSMIGLLHFKGDAILLSLLKPAKDVGIYAVAYRFMDQAFFLPGVFMAAVFPVLTRALHRDDKAGDAAINQAFRVLLLAGTALTILLVVGAHPLVALVSGDRFDASATPLRILAFAIPVVFVAPVFYNAVIAVDKQRELIVVGIASLVFNVVLNLILIPRYSYNGAAATTLVSESFSCAASFVVAKRWVRFGVRWSLVVRVLVAAAAAGAAAWLVRGASGWIGMVVAEAVFVGGAFGIGAVTASDLRLVLRRRAAG